MTQRPRPGARRLFGLSDNGALLLVMTTAIWGGNAIAGKLAVGHVSPLLLTLSRWCIASLILLFIARRYLVADWPVIRGSLVYLFFTALIGFSGFNALLYTSLVHTSAINVTIIQAAMPMFIFALNFAVFRTRVNWAQSCGYSLTLTGVLLTAAGGDLASLAGLAVNRGDAIMLVAVLFYAAYSVALGKKPDIHWLSLLTVLIVCAAVSALPMALYEATTQNFTLPTSFRGWAVVIYTALLPSIVAQGFYIRGVELLGGNNAGLFLNLVPIFGALFAVLLLGEAFHAYHALSIALVIGGIVLAQRLAQRGADKSR